VTDELINSTGNFAELVAASTPTPGGGSVAAFSGVLAASLGRMMCNLTLGKAKFAAVETRVTEIRGELERLGARLRQLISDDAASFEAVLAAYRLPKETDEEKAERKRQVEDATRRSIDVPLETAQVATEVQKLLGELSGIGNPNAFSDLAVGSQLADTAVRGAHYNIGVNLKSLSDRAAADRIGDKIANLVSESGRINARIESEMLEQME
jgi:formiminotetrahydrofolate cyclodeaminase